MPFHSFVCLFFFVFQTSTYAIADNSSQGLLGGGYRAVNVKVAQTTNNIVVLHFISQAIDPS